jgi:hypothetical protein
MKYDECIRNIDNAIRSPPSMIFSMRHFHTTGENKTVNTGVTEENFRFVKWFDLSAPPDSL